MPFALAASFVTAAPVSCTPLRSVVLHSTALRSIRCPVRDPSERIQRLELMNQLAPKQPEILGCAYVVPLSKS